MFIGWSVQFILKLFLNTSKTGHVYYVIQCMLSSQTFVDGRIVFQLVLCFWNSSVEQIYT